MTISENDVVDYIKNMSLMNASALVKRLEEELGVSAAAPVAMMAMGGAGAGAAQPEGTPVYAGAGRA